MISYSSISKRWIALVGTLGLALVAFGVWQQLTNVVIGRVEAASGDQIAYVKLADRSSMFVGDLYLLNVNQNTTTQLTRNMKVTGALWMPDGDHLAIIERPKGSVLNYYVLNVRAGTIQPVSYAEFQQIEVESGGRLPLLLEDSVSLIDLGVTIHAASNYEHICLTEAGSTACQSGEPYSAALSPDETRMVYVSTKGAAMSGKSLCVARTELESFEDASCYDRNPYGFGSLDWKPS